MHRAVRPIMPCILQYKENGDLHKHCCPSGKGHASFHPEVFSHGVENPYLGQFDSEMAEEDEFGTVPLFLGGGHLLSLDLVLLEIWDLADDDPGERATKVDRFVHDKTHDTGGENIVVHVGVPTL